MTESDIEPLRIAVIGAGFMGRQHIAFVARSPNARLIAVADPAAADAGFACPVFPDTATMLDGVRPDAVIIANPNALHVETAIACLEAGLAVLVEKPVATDLRQARLLSAATAKLGGRLLVGHHRRHHPSVAPARAALADGRIGRLVAVSGMWAARKDDAYFADIPWHRLPGAGVTLINLVHDLDLLRHLCGEVSEVQAMASSHARGLEVEDTVSVSLRFESGAVGSFLATDAGVSPWGWDQSTEDSGAFPYLPGGVAYRFVGTRGALSAPDLALFAYDSAVSPDWHSPLSRTYLPSEVAVSFHAQLEHFIEVARGTAAPLVSADDAARTLTLIEAIGQAARSSSTVDVTRFARGAASATSEAVLP